MASLLDAPPGRGAGARCRGVGCLSSKGPILCSYVSGDHDRCLTSHNRGTGRTALDCMFWPC
jgi:hypothetical protein